MSDVVMVAIFSLVGGFVSLSGGLLLIASKRTEKLLGYVVPFAGGALLAAAFMDVLAEAVHKNEGTVALSWTMLGIVAFFLLERGIHWLHRRSNKKTIDATVPLIVVGDSLHNFIDGIAIAAAFLIDVPTGILTTLVVAAHEIPQEIGDFGLLLSKGVRRKDVIKLNILSSLVTAIAAVVFFQLGQLADISLGAVLGIVAGFFIYIVVGDILPSLHRAEGERFAGLRTIMFVVGMVLVSTLTTSLHGVIEAPHEAAVEGEHHSDHHEE
ncbi:MAG TPA: ZIP family metal transporter [Candidatus Saccharimonadales bacterium]